MASVFLSPGVFPREIDLSVLPTGTGAIIPAFIGTAKKGPVQTPTFVSNSQQFIDGFGEPFPESFLGYAVLAYMEEGNKAWILRVGIECEEGLPEELDDVCIDVSGAREKGWGRVTVFSGIDFGKICTRIVDADNPIAFHDASVSSIEFNDIETATCVASATLSFTGSELSAAYTGVIDDSFTVLITSNPDPSGASVIDGAGYQVIKTSNGNIVSEGVLVESGTPGTSEPIDIGDGLAFEIVVTGACALTENDSFTFLVAPDNKTFSFRVARQAVGTITEFSFTNGDTYSTAGDFADALNALVGLGEDYKAIAQEDDTVCIRSKDAGDNIQLVSEEAWALEVGQVLYAFDIPRSFLLGTESGPFTITSSSDLININVISPTETEALEFTIPTGAGLTASSVAASLSLGGIKAGERFFTSFALKVPGGEELVVIETYTDHENDQLELLADFSHINSFRFAEELGILFPYTKGPRGFSDSRAVLPDEGAITPASPLSCEVDPLSDECLADSAYFASIVGWFVAKTPGTWIDDLSATLQLNVKGGSGEDIAGTFNVLLFNSNGIQVSLIEDVSFDPREDRYIGNVINDGAPLAGINGNEFVQWIRRPSFLGDDPDDVSTFEVRVPTPFNKKEFDGAADGFSTDPIFSSQLDAVVIGNPALNTGIFAFQNAELFDITLLVIPGFTSGAVIGQGLQLCEGRGDCLFIVDPPQGLTAQQVVEWHNGMLLSDLSAAINSSYGALYHPHLKIFDQFNAINIFVPPSGFASSVFARTENETEIWFAPAGLNRGRLLTALDVEFELTNGERDLLYGLGNAVNPIAKFPQDGIVIFGQRTLQRKRSALDRINVRMLLIFIKKNLVILLRNFLFEPNDPITRASVVAAIEPFLSDIAARRGLTAFQVICDERNNTPERIDRNELHVALLLKPTRAIEFIVLNLAILRTEASFSSEEILAAAGIVT